MSRTSSPPPLSDDSALGSGTPGGGSLDSDRAPLAQKPLKSIPPHLPRAELINSPNNENLLPSSTSKFANTTTLPLSSNNKLTPNRHNNATKFHRLKPSDLIVSNEDLNMAARQMRNNHVGLISRSTRTYLSCFDDLDITRFESHPNCLINFISNGAYKCSSDILRPVSIIWPNTYDKMVEELSKLDAFLLNTEFRDKPIEWMIKRGLAAVPNCNVCQSPMKLKYDSNVIVRWACNQTQPCTNYFMPIQRTSFFKRFEGISLDKLLFSVYFWSVCTPAIDLYQQINMGSATLDCIWRGLQNVCRIALEKTYPRHRLTNMISSPGVQSEPQPIDLVSIKLNENYVVCAKHPHSNLVRLGVYIPHVSQYSFAELIEAWFAHGAHVRTSESKFKDLAVKRDDLRLERVTRLEMVSKDGRFDRNSAFGYLICQLAHVLKDIDSSSLSCEDLKLLIAELQWRELYGTTPFDAFTNIVSHMAQYGNASDCYAEILPPAGTKTVQIMRNKSLPSENELPPFSVYVERYFYARIDPVDAEGKVIRRFSEEADPTNIPEPDVRIPCHLCKFKQECFGFSLHMIRHIEENRRETKQQPNNHIECKHCFKTFPKGKMQNHLQLFRSDYHKIRYGCRICCVQAETRSLFLEHMRTYHFEYETPYRCPSCPFASSFQREVFIHFQEEHRHSIIILCPLCLRSFTIAKPEVVTHDKITELSKLVYNHLAEHYVVSRQYTCELCCLCFLNKDKLGHHRKQCHNPLEIRSDKTVKLEKFIITKEEEDFCVRALPVELFIANKRPNQTVETTSNLPFADAASSTADCVESGDICSAGHRGSANSSPSLASSSGSSIPPPTLKRKRKQLEETDTSSSDTDSISTTDQEGLIHVRGLGDAKCLLKGCGPTIQVSQGKGGISTKTYSQKASGRREELTSAALIACMSLMKRADGVVPNQSVILVPSGKPAKCVECLHLLTIDHYVARIKCARCKYVTFCPRAAMKHNANEHGVK